MNDHTPRLHLSANEIIGAIAVADYLSELLEEVAAHSGPTTPGRSTSSSAT